MRWLHVTELKNKIASLRYKKQTEVSFRKFEISLKNGIKNGQEKLDTLPLPRSLISLDSWTLSCNLPYLTSVNFLPFSFTWLSGLKSFLLSWYKSNSKNTYFFKFNYPSLHYCNSFLHTPVLEITIQCYFNSLELQSLLILNKEYSS